MKFALGISTLLSVAFSATSALADSCQPYREQIWQHIVEYNKEAFDSKTNRAEDHYLKIQDILFKQVGEDEPCFQTLADSYVSFAYGIYDPNKIGRGQMGSSVGLISGGITSVQNRQTPTFVTKLFEHKKVVYLTDASRKQLGGIWAEKDHQGEEYNLIGGYDCAETKIYLDISLRPFDLTATLTHELDHLYRDKAWNIDPKLMTNDEDGKPQINWTLYNLADEALAITAGASVFIGAKSSWEVDPFWGSLSAIHHHYKITNDFTLFSKNGPVSRFRSNFIFEGPTTIARELSGDSDYRKNENSENGLSANLAQAKAERNQYFSIIAQTYFPGQSIELPDGKDYDDFFEFDGSPWKTYPKGNDFISYNSMDMNYDPQNDVIKAIDAPQSQTCRAYLDSLSKTSVNHYLGTRFSKTSSIRPCVNFKHSL